MAKITPDTNILVRAAVQDHEFQSAAAQTALASADLIAVPLATICEFVWVLEQVYKRPAAEIANSIRGLLADERVETNRLAVEAGLSVLAAGGDFADGAIAYEGRQLGGEVFVTFDKRAARLVSAAGDRTELLPSSNRK